MIEIANLFKIFFKNEIHLILKSRGRVIANIMYFLIIISIFQILTQNSDQSLTSTLFIIITLIAILCTIISITHDFFDKDFNDGTLEQIIIHCQNLEIFIIAKCLANWCCSCLIICLIASLFSLLQTSIFNFWFILITLSIMSLSLFFLLAFCGSLSMIGGFASMISVIALPITLPVLILSCASILDNFWVNFKILLALCVLIISISSYGCAKIIKIANN